MPDTSSRALLEADLRSLGHALDAALGERDLSLAVAGRLTGTRRARPGIRARRRLVIALVAGVVVTATAAIPAARAAVTSFFDIGVVRVHETPPPPGRVAAGALMLGEPTTLDEARARMPVVVPLVGGLATPDGVWFEDRGGGAVSLVYQARPGLPAARHTDGIGLLIQEFNGDGTTAVEKYLGESSAQRVTVGDSPGVFLSGGDHRIFYQAPNGADVFDNGRVVGNALIFQRGNLTIRLEGNLSRERMVEIASSLA